MPVPFQFHRDERGVLDLDAATLRRGLQPPASILLASQRVAIGGVKHVLPRPFHVLATQNPIEQEGTYPLREAQLDRFLLEVNVNYPDVDADDALAGSVTSGGELSG